MHSTRREFLKAGVLTGLSGWWLSAEGNSAHGEGPQPRAALVQDDIAAAADRAELSLRLQGTTVEDVRAWQQAFRGKLNDLLGDTSPPGQWKAVEEHRTELDDHIRYELLLTTPEHVPSVPVYLLVPRGASSANRAPGVLCVHGHGNYGHHPIVGRTDIEGVAAAIERAHYDYGLQFVRRGYVVAAPCMIPFGRRVDREKYGRDDPCAVTFVRMQALGKLPLAENLRDLRWCLDLLQSRPEVAGERIGCAGLSYGGRMTMFAAAMDERIRVAAPSGAFNLLQERIMHRYSCGSQIVPGLLKYGDYSEVGSLIAPRPCVWEIGSKDSLISPQWAAVFRRRLQRAYQAYGALNQLHFDEFDGGHQWNGRVAFPVFDEALKA